MSTNTYYIIIFIKKQDKKLNPVCTVPASWIRWQKERIETVIVAYPEEPWKVTMERVKRYEDPQRNWNSFLARIEGCSYNYSSMIRSINEREHVGLETPQPGPSHSSAPPTSDLPLETAATELRKWVSGLPSYFDQNPFPIRTMEDYSTLKYLISETEQEIEIERNSAHGTSETPTRSSAQSSRFAELVPNSRVYIEKSELEICVMSSGNCLHLARLLMKHFFSTTALKKDPGLEERAITAIIDFVLPQGPNENRRESSRKSIESALRFQLHWLKMNTNQTRVYHVVQLVATQNNLINCVKCIPASWIQWQNNESTKVLVAYPDELQEITRERVKNYENPRGYWNLYWAQIKYSTDSYDSAIRDINERERSLEESSSSKIICTENESSNSSAPLSSEMNDSKAYWPELQRWLNRLPDSDKSQVSMVNRMYEVISSDSELSDQENIDREENDVPLDLSMSSKTVQKLTPSALQDLRGVNDIYDLTTSRGTCENLTLKYLEYAPGLMELIPNSGIYIAEAELEDCLGSSRKCTQLARNIVKHIFTTTALNVGDQNSLENHRLLRLKATSTIVKFVLDYGILRNWDSSSDKSLRGAIWYQQSLLKKNAKQPHVLNAQAIISRI